MTKLTTLPVLVYFDPLVTTNMETDATKDICFSILSQRCQDGQWRQLAYSSRTMSEAECNYAILQKELLVIVATFHKWKRYTIGSPKPVRAHMNPKKPVNHYDNEGTK